MPAPYSYDLRTKVIEAIDGGMGKTQASKIFRVVVIQLTYGFREEKKQETIEQMMDINRDMGQKSRI